MLLGLKLSLPGNDSSTISDRLTHCSLSHKKMRNIISRNIPPPSKKKEKYSKDRIEIVFHEADFSTHCSLLFTRYSLLFYSLLVAFLLVTHYLLLVTRYFYLLHFTHYSLLFTHYLLFFTHYSLLFTYYFLLVTHDSPIPNFRPQKAHFCTSRMRSQPQLRKDKYIMTQIVHLGPRIFRPQIIWPDPNCRPQISKLAPRSKT